MYVHISRWSLGICIYTYELTSRRSLGDGESWPGSIVNNAHFFGKHADLLREIRRSWGCADSQQEKR
jgi:hypothetical protein